jgi:hypothetical protein
VQACLVIKLGGLEEEASREVGGATDVGSSGVLMGFGMRFHNFGKVEKILVGGSMVVHNAHGGGIHGVEGGRGLFFFYVSCWVMVFPLWCVVWFLMVVLIPPTMRLSR